MRKLLLILLIPCMGCTATMVNTRGQGSNVNAPVNEGKGGTVKYSMHGSVRGKRNSAYREMHEYCQGDYRITQEYGSTRHEGSFLMGNMVLNANGKEWNIDFECVGRSL